MTSALVAVCLLTTPAFAAPKGGKVVAGSAAIDQAGGVTRITQHSNRAVIDWQSFAIAKGEAVRFEQPKATSATLNRVRGGQVSAILGRLDANGRVYLVNPNGIVFGADAQVNVAALVAATANISNQNFMAGRLLFDQPGKPGASIVNAGRITASAGGLVALVAPSVRNEGIISARLGRVTLAGGETFTLDLYGDGLINLALSGAHLSRIVDSDGNPVSGSIEHSGRIDAPGGKVVFVTAATGTAVLDDVINMSGVVEVDAVAQEAGQIVLLGQGGTVSVSGSLSAQGTGAGQSGGAIEVSGDAVRLSAGAELDASGQAGGGSIHVGGDYQGGGTLYRATTTVVESGAQLDASAVDAGDGGEVVVWADGHTDFAGRIRARGGATSGDGGEVEVSGKETLDFSGLVDAGASNGQAGSLLLDPAFFTVDAADAALLSLILSLGMDVALEADVDITVNGLIDGRGGVAGAAIDMLAGNDINLNHHVITNDGAITLTATAGTVDVAAGRGVFSGTAQITVTAGGTFASAAYMTTGDLALSSTGGSINLNGGIGTDAGDVSLSAFDDITITAPILNLWNGSALEVTAGGDITVAGQIDGSGGPQGLPITLSAGGAIAVTEHIVTNNGAVTLSAAGGTISLGAGKAIVSGTAPLTVTAGGPISAGAVLSAGDLNLTSSGGSVTVSGGIDAKTRDVALSAASDVTISSPILNLQNGSALQVTAGGDITVSGQIDGSGGPAGTTVALTAGGAIAILEHLVTNNRAVTLSATGGVALAADKGIFTGAAPITVTAGGTVTAAGTLLTTGDLSLSSSAGSVNVDGGIGSAVGEVTIAAFADVTISSPIINLANGSSLAVTAGNDITVSGQIDGSGASAGGTVTMTAGNNLAVSNHLVTNEGAVDLTATAGTVALAVDKVIMTGSAPLTVTAGGTISAASLLSVGDLALTSSGGTVAVSGGIGAETQDVVLRAANNIDISAPIQNLRNGSSLTATAGNEITVSAQIDAIAGSAGGTVTMTAGNDIAVNEPIATNNGAITLTATAGTVAVAAGRVVFAGSGPITVEAGATLSSSGYATGNVLSLTSTGGSINVDSGIDDVDTGAVVLDAFNHITITAPIQNLQNGSSLMATAGGDINVNDQIDGDGGASGAPVLLMAGGDINVNEHIVTNDGAITLIAGGAVTQAADGLDAFGAPLTKQIRSGSAAITIDAGGGLSVGSYVTTGLLNVTSGGNMVIAVPVYETVGDTTISSGGTLAINEVLANSTTGADLFLESAGTMTVNAKVGPWDRATGGILGRDDAVAGGAITLVSGGDIDINEDIATFDGTLSLFAGTDVDLTANCAAPPCTVNLIDGKQVRIVRDDMNVPATLPELSITAFSDLTNGPAPADVDDPILTGYLNKGPLNITSTTGTVTVTQAIPVEIGEVTISAGDAVLVNQPLQNDGSGISIFAGPGGIVQSNVSRIVPGPPFDATISAGDIDAQSGSLYMEAVGDILPTTVRANITITIKSTAGVISGGSVQPTSVGGQKPNTVLLAGFEGISGFNATGAGRLEAISANGSIVNVSNNANFIRLIAKENITNIPVDGNAELFAGHDISIKVPLGGNLLIKAGGDVAITASRLIFGTLDLTTGQDPFADLGGITIAGVSAPTWTPPIFVPPFGPGAGNVTLGNNNNTLTYAGSITIDASGNIDLARTKTPVLDLTAGGSVFVQQTETLGPYSITAGEDITLASRIGQRVGVDPTNTLWNPTDLGVESVDLLAINGDINWRGARAQGDITAAAPLGQVIFNCTFCGAVSEGGGTVTLTDSDGVVNPPVLESFATRFPLLDAVLPAISPGPTLAGPVAPSLAGAQPPGAPSGASVAGLGAPGGVTLASLSASGATVTDASASGASLSGPRTSGVSVTGTSTPGAETTLSEVFVDEPAVATLTLTEIIPSDEAGGDDVQQSAISAGEDGEPEIVVGAGGEIENLFTFDSFNDVELVFAGGRGEAQEEDLQ